MDMIEAVSKKLLLQVLFIGIESFALSSRMYVDGWEVETLILCHRSGEPGSCPVVK